VPRDPSTAAPSKRYRSIRALQHDLAGCRLCVDAGYPLDSLPVVHGTGGRRAYLYGQAPGIVEGAEGAPWRGRAGKTLRRWLELDEDAFYAAFYCASVTRCYPGRSPSGSGDRVPAPREQELCSFWLDWELRLLRPELVVTVGGLATRRLVPARGLGECIGRTFEHAGATVIPLPHPSGVSRWLNTPENRRQLDRALALIRTQLDALEDRGTAISGG
jgi:uracil-DNA glycosylase family 4